MGHYSVLVVAHDELDNLLKDPNLGENIKLAVLRHSSYCGEGHVLVNKSLSTMRVISSFNSNAAPRALITEEGWHWYDKDKDTVPPYLKKYLRENIQ